MYKGKGEYIMYLGGMYKGRRELYGMNGRDVQLYIPRSTGVYTLKGGRQCRDIIYNTAISGERRTCCLAASRPHSRHIITIMSYLWQVEASPQKRSEQNRQTTTQNLGQAVPDFCLLTF